MKTTGDFVRILLTAFALAFSFSTSVLPAAAQIVVDETPADPAIEPEGEFDLLTVFNDAYEDEVAQLVRAQVLDAASADAVSGAASNLRDLLSLFVAGLDLGELSGDGQNLVLALNPQILDWGRGQGSGKVTMREAEISERLLMALPEEVREARKTALLDGLNEFDDVELALTWTWESSRIGRDPSDYTALIEALPNAFDSGISSEQAMQRLLASLDAGAEPSREQVEHAAREQARDLASWKAVLDEHGYFRVGELISNQPQLYADFTGRFRDELIGQDEYGLSVTWESGVANVNGLLRRCATERAGAPQTRIDRMQAVTPGCYSRFLEDHAVDWSKRWKVKVEYAETQSDAVELPADDLFLDLDSAHTFRVTGGFGFDLPPLPETGNSPPRLDFEAKYEDVSDDEVRSDDRLTASLTFTQKVTDSSAATLSVVYANKPELLGEVDEELSARVGLKFSLDKEKDSSDK